ncbi:hypothetical protein [Streptomyces sp. Y7]|uniref:hypothetical protein n=1 Tax=Streptomyces sp. Y7 TaxID=3342392 RepID=UPI0037125646
MTNGRPDMRLFPVGPVLGVAFEELAAQRLGALEDELRLCRVQVVRDQWVRSAGNLVRIGQGCGPGRVAGGRFDGHRVRAADEEVGCTAGAFEDVPLLLEGTEQGQFQDAR